MLLYLVLHRFAPVFSSRKLDHEPPANPQNASNFAAASGSAAEWNAAGACHLVHFLQREHANLPNESCSATADRRLNGTLSRPVTASSLHGGTGVGEGGQQFVIVIGGDALAHGVVEADDLQRAACQIVEQARFV